MISFSFAPSNTGVAILKPSALLQGLSGSPAPVRCSYGKVHPEGSARYQEDVRSEGMAYPLQEVHGKRHPCYHDDRPSYHQQRSFSSVQCKYVLLVYARRKLHRRFSCKYLGIYDNTIFTVRYLKGSISYFSCLLTKDSTEQSLLCGQLCFSLRSNLTNQNITGTNLSTDTDDTSSSRSFSASSPTPGTSLVISSGPSLVSLASASYSSI